MSVPVPWGLDVPILLEDNHLLVVSKPAGIATMGAADGESSMADWAAAYLKEKYNKPGNVFVGVVSRLDSMVSGALVMARTSKSASRLSEQFRERTVEKKYYAVIEGTVHSESGSLKHLLSKNENAHRMEVVSRGQVTGRDIVEATLEYRVLHRGRDWTALEVELVTGRKHQIRVQLAKEFGPILGDRKYDSGRLFPQGIALHSHRLSFDHPTGKHRITLDAPLPQSWMTSGVALPWYRKEN